MTHTVCEPCHDCKYTDCVAVCPVECFYQDDMMLYIDPNDCIDCEACVPECPVEAIFAEANVPAQWTHYTPLNAEKSAAIEPSWSEAGGRIVRTMWPRQRTMAPASLPISLGRGNINSSAVLTARSSVTLNNTPERLIFFVSPVRHSALPSGR